MAAHDLLPCPFCGGAVTLRHYIHKYDDAFVYCDVCEIEGARTSNNDTAIAAWNRRDPAAIRAAALELPEVKAMVEAATEFDNALDTPGANVGSPRLKMWKALVALAAATKGAADGRA
jgi:Lar family restriction alleviation protein